MDVKSKRVYIFAGIIFLWNIITIYLDNIIKHSDVVNFLFWIIILIICLILFKKEYKRDKYKSIIFKDILIFTLLYVIIYYMSGLLLGFKKSPLDFNFYNIISNLGKYVLLRVIMETTKYYLIKENTSKLFLFLVTVLFIFVNIDINYLNLIIDSNRDLFKYISSDFVPLVMYGIVGTYLIKYGDIKANLILQLTPIVLMYTIPISPNMDWYLSGVFHTIYLVIVYVYIKYEIEKREDSVDEAKKNVFALAPVMMLSTLLILFVLGVFKYVPIGALSNSMKPVFEKGDVIIYQKIKNPAEIKVNDIICYKLDDIKVMHRVVKIEKVNNKKYFTTKGDNTKTNDPLKVEEKQIIGKIEFIIPRLGYPTVWLYELLR